MNELIESMLKNLEELNGYFEESEYKDKYLRITDRIKQDLKFIKDTRELEELIKANPDKANQVIF